METKEYIASGILELYVYGLLSEAENIEIAEKAKQHPEIEQEIIAIEKSIVALSSSFSPFQSVANYEKIKNQLALKHGKVIEMQPQKKWTPYLGWAAAAVLFVGIGFQYFKLNETQKTIVVVANEKKKIEQEFSVLDKKNKAIDLGTLNLWLFILYIIGLRPFAFAARSDSVRRPIGFRPPSDRIAFAAR